MRLDRSTTFLNWLEWTLLVAGIACLTWYGLLSYRADRIEADNREAVTRMLAARAIELPQSDVPDLEPLSLPDSGLFIGQLDIPRLHLSAPIKAGDDADVLDGSVGYLPDTPPPWSAGNTALAAHRDRLFRPLAHLRIGDDIVVSTGRGDFHYVVSRTFVVNRSDLWVLDSAPDVDLTLITCYPFSFVGHAPQRFVVRARKTVTPYAATFAH